MRKIYISFIIIGITFLFGCSVISDFQVQQAEKNIAASDTLVAQAQVSLDAGDHKTALELYSKALVKNPDNAQAYFGRGNLYLEFFSDYLLAIQDYTYFLRIDPDNAPAYVNRGLAHVYLQDFEAALENFNQAIELDPNYAKAYADRGFTYASMHELNMAMEDYNTSINIQPSKDAHYNRGIGYFNTSQYKLAEEDFQATILIDRQYVDAYIGLAEIYILRKEYDSAFLILDEAMETISDSAKLFYTLGRLNYTTCGCELALRDLDQAISLNPDYLEAYLIRALIYDRFGEYELAAADYAVANALAPSETLALSDLARAYYKSKDYAAAILVYTRIIELLPETEKFYILRGIVYQDNGDMELAEIDFASALELYDEIEFFYIARAREYIYFDEIDKYYLGLVDINYAIELDPEIESSYVRRGDIYLALGEVELAVADYNTALEISHYPTWHKIALDKLAALGREPRIPLTPVPTREKVITENIYLGVSENDITLLAARIGLGPRNLVLIGSLHGNETKTYDLLFNIGMHYLESLPPDDFTLYIIPTANPDGNKANTWFNANGVDLGRNWDTSQWEADIQGPSGAIIGGGGSYPFSEPETAVISNLLLELQASSSDPVIVIFYHEHSTPSSFVQPSYTLSGQILFPDAIASAFGQGFAESVNAEFSNTFEDYEFKGDPLLWCGENDIICLNLSLPTQFSVTEVEILFQIEALDALILAILSN